MKKLDGWQPIETAPTHLAIDWITDGHECGPHILVCTEHGEVLRARWWQYREKDSGEISARNFIQDSGQPCYPTHWMPLPLPPFDRD